MTEALAVPLARPLFEQILDDADRPLLAVALHHGADLRDEVCALLAIDEPTRRREEDPFSGAWTSFSPNRMIALRSRFEVDLNRPPERSVYLAPEDAWGLTVWREPPPPRVVACSLEEYSSFYRAAHATISHLLARNERVLVLDLHSFNHRRAGPEAVPLRAIPDLNVGTGSLDRARWGRVVDALIERACAAGVDVRENAIFRGGYFPYWVNETFAGRACALALEVKKTFMDEWTGRVDLARLAWWREILRDGARAALEAMEAR